MEWCEKRYMPLMVSVIRKYYTSVEWLSSFAEECKNRDIRLVVLSDYGHTHEKLAALGIDKHLFDWVVSAPELGGLKPAAQLMSKVAEQMKITPNQCLVIGDREDTDGQLAQLTGARFFLV
jgi:phosphoglycolate phosphatase/putative hydrolase of the HAD superfamily